MKIWLLAGIAAFVAAQAVAEEPRDCFDARVQARIVHQVWTDIPRCGDDCVVMDWPWFLDLKIKRVLEGTAKKGVVRNVLSVQHTCMRSVDRTWLLRRNAAGGFNVVHDPDQGSPLTLCPAEVAPVEPYIAPADGKTLDDLRHDADRRNGG